MMDIRDELAKLPAPDPTAPARIWDRVQETRGRRRSPLRWVVPGVGLVAVAAAGLLMLRPGDAPRELALDAVEHADTVTWSEVVDLEVSGAGAVSGTDRDLEIAWESGTITAHVMPETGTRLAVVTEEARVEVVGTVFSVTRDALGVTTSVEKGRVRVVCEDGWEGFVGAGDAPHTCLPVTPARLLARADALTDAGAPLSGIADTLERGVAAAPGEVVLGELLVRRMRVRTELGDVPGALSDARRYLELDDPPRADEVRRHAGWTALGADGCAVARPFLEPLETTGEPADRVLLAECLVADAPDRARGLLEDALAAGLEADWAQRARTDLDRLEVR